MAALNGKDDEELESNPTNLIGKWFETYSVELRRYILRNHFHKDETEDLLHDVFVIALKRSSEYSEQGHARAYLYRITRNLMLASRRKRRPQNNVEPKCIEQTCDQEQVQQAECKDQAYAIRKRLNSISEEQRVVIHFRLEKGLSFKEIAKILDSSLNTVISHFHRGVTKLRKLTRNHR